MNDTEECIQCEMEFSIEDTICPSCGFDDDSEDDPNTSFIYEMYKNFIFIIQDMFDFDR